MTSLRQQSRVENLIKELLPRLHKTAYYLSRYDHEAEDAVQETLTRLFHSLEKDAMRIRTPVPREDDGTPA